MAAGKAAKLDIALSADIQRERWQKFIFLTAMAGSTATLRSSIGPIAADPELRGFFRALMEEAFAVGKAKGVALDPAYLDDRMDFLANKVEPGMKASMAHDLERGNRLELDWLAGKVAHSARNSTCRRRRATPSIPFSNCIAWGHIDAKKPRRAHDVKSSWIAGPSPTMTG